MKFLSIAAFSICAGLLRTSTACLIKYVPDAYVEDDHIPFPWEKDSKKVWPRKTLSSCSCGETNLKNAVQSWNALVKKDSETTSTFCGGTLINSYFILVAASCLFGENVTPMFSKVSPEDVTVWLNKPIPIDTSSKTGSVEVQEIIVEKRFLFQKFGESVISSNVALLKLKDEIDLGESDVSTICLFPNVDLPRANVFEASVSGWINCLDVNVEKEKVDTSSSTKCFRTISTHLEQINDCKEKSNDKHKIKKNQLCTFLSLQTEGSEYLSVPTTSGTTMQIGIASWNDEQAQRLNSVYSHQFYTDIRAMLPFINYYSASASWCKEPSEPTLKTIRTGQFIWDTFNHRTIRNDCVCGVHKAAMGRVAGGTDAYPNEFKWQVYLEIGVIRSYGGPKGKSLCGGSLINDRMILTAAHCVVQSAFVQAGNNFPGVDPEDIAAYLGLHNREKLNEGFRVKIKRVLFHPLYLEGIKRIPALYDWDVALLELQKPVELNPNKVMPVCIPTSEDIRTLEPVNLMGWSSGWGNTDPEKYSIPSILQKIQLKIQPRDYCNNIVPESERSSERLLCVGTLDKFNDVGSGDSGGPLSILAGAEQNQFLQVGIVSYGYHIGEKSAGYFTDVRKVLTFIDYHSFHVGWCPMTR